MSNVHIFVNCWATLVKQKMAPVFPVFSETYHFLFLFGSILANKDHCSFEY